MDELDQLKSQVNLLNYITQHNPSCKVRRVGINTQISPCPFCNKGVKSPHFTIYEQSNSFASFGCERNGVKGGTIIDYLMATENIDRGDAIKKLHEITNTPFNTRQAQEKQPQKPQEKKPSKEELQKINEFVSKNLEAFLKNSEAQAELLGYLATRYIGEEAIYKYHLFLREDAQGQKRVYIPIYEQGQAVAYIGRAIDSNAQLRYMNSQGTIQPFNIDYLSKEAETEDEPLFICEGVFDAISIEEQGKKAIALNSTQNVDKFCDTIKKHLETAKQYKFIIATDNDEARTKGKRETSNRTYKAKHSKQLFEDTNLLQGRKRVVL